MSFAVVTGASSGIGQVFARRLAVDHYDLVLVARRRPRLEALAEELRAAHGRRVAVVAADLATAAGRDALWQATERLGERVELLVNDAGFGLAGAFLELDRERQLEMIAINVTAVTDLAHRYLASMVAHGRGALVNVASLAAFQPVPFFAAYGASKAYVLALSEALAEEVRGSGVRVCALCPGPVPTEFQEIAGTRLEGAVRAVTVTPERCVELALAALDAGRVVVVPGIVTSLVAGVVGHLPRQVAVRAAGSVYRNRMKR
jgi:hypothetical protein